MKKCKKLTYDNASFRFWIYNLIVINVKIGGFEKKIIKMSYKNVLHLSEQTLLERFVDNTKRLHLKRGDLLIREGEMQDNFIFLLICCANILRWNGINGFSRI
ncbi:hypothetical protein [Agathobaculum sp. Marseille-P7918]|uniref:hypothetical protein n=1 Tax=Agathobaculum sp. Marseille-P7918 TaxID=2479843 RepID=UPI003569D892